MIYWILNILIISILSILVFRKWKQELHPSIYWSALLLKLLAGLALGIIFKEIYEGGDTFQFFKSAKALNEIEFGDYLKMLFQWNDYETGNQPRVVFFVKFLSAITWISGGSYWITSLYLSMISFIATWYFVLTCSKFYPNSKWLIHVCFLYVPTIVFWSSGILKDTLAYSTLLGLMAIVIRMYHEDRLGVSNWLTILISIYVLLKVKHYLLISFILFVGFLFFVKLLSSSKPKIRFASIGVLIVASIATQFVHPYLKINRIPRTLYENNQAIITKTAPEDQLDIVIDSPGWSSILAEAPKAMKVGLFSPTIMDQTSLWGWIHKIENLFLLFLCMFSILILLKKKPKIDWVIVLPAVLVICMLATMLALSTPNFGTLVRYKNSFMPFLFLLFSVLPYQFLTTKTFINH